MTKVCTKCGLDQPISVFAKSKDRSDGLTCWCRECRKKSSANWYRNMDPVLRKERETARKIRRKTPDGRRRNTEEHRWYFLKRKYGLTKEQYLVLLSSQGDKCAICGIPQVETDTFHLDHQHSPEDMKWHVVGKIRGILCGNCNTGLGQFKDNPEVLEKAARYLRLHMESAISILKDGAVPD